MFYVLFTLLLKNKKVEKNPSKLTKLFVKTDSGLKEALIILSENVT